MQLLLVTFLLRFEASGPQESPYIVLVFVEKT